MGNKIMMMVIIGAIAGALLSGIVWHIYYYKREKKLLSHLQEMIDQAVDGTYEMHHFSEDRLSLLENSFKQYLDSSMISEENQKEQKRAIQELISDIAHQTLTPISNLRIYSELLLEDGKCDSGLVQTVAEEVDKLDFLIQSLVKLSRMENGIISVHPAETPVQELFAQLSNQYRLKAEQKNITLVMEDCDICAKFDLKWSVEAVGNIVDNAIKYTGQGGKVSITAQKYSFFVRIDITDNGIGIEAEEIPKIFARFYRSFEVADKPGVGIGLYLARQIISAQKGYMKVASQKGEGSTFSVFFPIQ